MPASSHQRRRSRRLDQRRRHLVLDPPRRQPRARVGHQHRRAVGRGAGPQPLGLGRVASRVLGREAGGRSRRLPRADDDPAPTVDDGRGPGGRGQVGGERLREARRRKGHAEGERDRAVASGRHLDQQEEAPARGLGRQVGDEGRAGREHRGGGLPQLGGGARRQGRLRRADADERPSGAVGQDDLAAAEARHGAGLGRERDEVAGLERGRGGERLEGQDHAVQLAVDVGGEPAGQPERVLARAVELGLGGAPQEGGGGEGEWQEDGGDERDGVRLGREPAAARFRHGTGRGGFPGPRVLAAPSPP